MKVSDSKIGSRPVMNYSGLFRYADQTDKLLMVGGSISAFMNGIAMPMFALLIGQMTEEFGPFTTGEDFVGIAWKFAKYYFYMGCTLFVLSFIQVSCWMTTGQRQATRLRMMYFHASVNQNIEWYDKDINPQELSSQISSDSFDFQNGIGEKVGTFIMALTMTLSAFAIGYLRGWQLALVMTISLPFLGLSMVGFVWVIQNMNRITVEVYSKAGAKAEETLGSIRTIKALCGEEYEYNIYSEIVQGTLSQMLKLGFVAGLAIGFMMFANLGEYAVGFYAGTYFIKHQTWNEVRGQAYTVGDVLVVFFSIIMGAFNVGQIQPCMKAFATAKVSGGRAFKIIDDAQSVIEEERRRQRREEGMSVLRGEMVLSGVRFRYPSCSEREILRGVNLRIGECQKVALVGQSGSGKSTICQLIEGFYEVSGGSIEIGQERVSEMSRHRLRSVIGYVGQEPALFAMTVEQNLRLGKWDASEEEMKEALRQAQALDFVMGLENGLQTFVGPAGNCQLSGGQKQRIAIARALINRPSILLLDEATSALDRANEELIQKTLDQVAEGRTTLIIAHRLSTIRNADVIVVMKDGQIVEQGTHESLIEQNEHYANLVRQQMQAQDEMIEQVAIVDNTDDNQTVIRVDEDIRVPLLVKRKSSVISVIEETTISQQLDKQMIFKLLAFNKEKLHFMILGILAALANGTIFPMYSIFLGKIMIVLAMVEAPTFDQETSNIIMWFIILACISLFTNLFQAFSFSSFGENLTVKIRCTLYQKLLYMPISFFDKEENSAGALSSKLANDAAAVKNLCTDVIGLILQSISSFVTGITIALFYSWKLTLVSVAMSPLVVLAGKFQAGLAQGFSADSDQAQKNTLNSLNARDKIYNLFQIAVQKPTPQAQRKALLSGIGFGISQWFIYINYAVVFYCGAVFFKDVPFIDRADMFRAVFALVFAAFGSGYAFQFLPDFGQAASAASYFFNILSLPDERSFDSHSNNNNIVIKSPTIQFKDVYFKYPSRKQQILSGISFIIHPAAKHAFVGQSGSGKSTIIQLILRFYDIQKGTILVDGIDIKMIPIKTLRNYFGVVAQEPVLFDTSFEQNIRYNTNNDTQQVREAAQSANALDFIDSMNRQVGPKGNKLSGGQKQRVAIARAIIKKPKILLLDEATSALDSVNEQIVQKSLDNVIEGVTSITISHRIASILKSNKIFVIDKGVIIAQGSIVNIDYQQKIVQLSDSYIIAF